MLDETLGALSQLKDSIKEASCVSQDPFMKLGTGAAPTLNYDIPQTATFSTYGTMQVNVDPGSFVSTTNEIPKNNFFDQVEALPVETVQQNFAEAVQLQTTGSSFVPNVQLLRAHIDVAKTDWNAVAIPPTVEQGQALPARVFESSNAINEVQLATHAKNGLMPYAVEKFGGFKTKLNFLSRPPAPKPYIVVIEEYKTCSYLGDYGAGGTVQTFSLLPGEQTTISIRTYKDMISTSSYSDNILDSFSESSTDDIEKNLEMEMGNSSTDSDNTTRNGNVNAGVSASLFGIIKVGVGGGYSSTSNSTSTRSSNMKLLSSALNRHVETTNNNRQINVNTTTSDSVSSGEEETITRSLVNYNKSRVLNFVFRQLMQQYVTVTYLSNVRVAYCNGYAESLRIVNIENLDSLLNDVIVPAQVDAVRTQILKPYCTVMNYQDNPIQFIEQMNVDYGQCLGTPGTETFWRVRKNLQDTYTSGGLNINVNGVILNVSTHNLRTPSVVVDALLGQGEALDCFNQKTQDAAAIQGYLQNLQLLQQIQTMEDITDPTQRATLYKKVFGTCCDGPQVEVVN